MPGIQVDAEAREVVITQSWLQDFMRCAERGRRQVLDPQPSTNDATVTGTAVHRYMERRLSGEPHTEARQAAADWLATTVECDPEFRFVQVKTLDTMLAHFQACVLTMETHVVPQVPAGGQVEHTLRYPLTEVDDWLILLEGTPDYVDPFGRVWDWKTATRPYVAAEAKHWMIQPTAYTYLASMARTVVSPVTDFTYVVTVKPYGDLQMLDVTRGPNDWRWLGRVARGAVQMMERFGLTDEWPANHMHWLCSEKFCPYWATCRGRFAAPDATIQTAEEAL